MRLTDVLPCAPMLFEIDGEPVDALDLKILLTTRGLNVPDELIARFGPDHRLQPNQDPCVCNCLLLPGGVPAHMFNVGADADFSLAVGDAGKPWLTHRGRPVTEVGFPPASDFYTRRTSAGMPFGWRAVLQGVDVLSFPFLWNCQFALAGQPCHFCYQGNISLGMQTAGMPLPGAATPLEVVEIVEHAVRHDGIHDVQLTGGSLIGTLRGEIPLLLPILEAIQGQPGLRSAIQGEVYAYTSAPRDPSAVDELFAAGLDRVSYDLDVWDEDLWRRICPGIARHIGRPQQLRALEYAAERHGPNKVCTAFVVGLEPVESLLAGAAYVAERGIVPLFSTWMPHQRPVLGSTTPPGLDYYRRARAGFLELFRKHQLQPPGASGLNVCVCRDLARQAARPL